MLRVERCSSYGHQAVPEAAAFTLQEAVVRVQMELKVVIYRRSRGGSGMRNFGQVHFIERWEVSSPDG